MSESLAELSERVEFLERSITALHEVTRAVMQYHDLLSFGRNVFQILKSVVPFDAGLLEYYDHATDQMTTIYSIDEAIELDTIVVWNYKQSAVISWIVKQKQAVRFDDFSKQVNQRFPKHQVRTFGQEDKISKAWMSVPLLVHDQLVGVINVQSYEAGIYQDQEQQFVEFLARPIGVTLSNAALVSALETRIEELNLPYIVLNEDIAIVPLIDGLSLERLNEFSERLLDFVTRFGHEHVLFDLSGVRSYDEYIIQALSTLIKALLLSGAQPMLIGMHPMLIEGLVHMDVAFHSIRIARDLPGALHILRISAAKTTAK